MLQLLLLLVVIVVVAAGDWSLSRTRLTMHVVEVPVVSIAMMMIV